MSLSLIPLSPNGILIPKLLQQGTPQSSLCSLAFSQFPPHYALKLTPIMHSLAPTPPPDLDTYYFLFLQPSSFRSLPLASFLPLCCGRYYAWIQPLLLSKNQWGTCWWSSG